jgi:VCBS repeat-containing protein
MLNAVLALNELDTTVFDSPSLGASPRVDADYVTVPDAHLLFTGEFKRVGTNDLKIVGADGESFFIADYFAADKRPHLMSPEGATLSPHVVEALAGPLAPGQHAQAGTPAASGQPVIGRVDGVTGSATVVRNGVSVALNVGDNVRQGDVVQTSGSSSVAIVLADGSTFSLNANARMVLDSLVYNAGGAGNSALISLVQGTFSFVAGQVAKTGEMRVETPVATMGIRGTAVLVEISSTDGQTKFSVMVEPDGTTGAFNLYNKTTGALIGTVNNSQVGWVLTPSGPLQVLAQQVAKTPGELQQELGIVQQIFTIFNNNQQNPFTPPATDPERRGDDQKTPTKTDTAQAGGSGETFTVTVPVVTPDNPRPADVTLNVTVTPVANNTPPTTSTGTTTPGGTPGTPTPPPGPPSFDFSKANEGQTIVGTNNDDTIIGSRFGDSIDAGAGNDIVSAGDGDDTIIAGHGEGDDQYDGGAAFDTITFTSANGVVFHLNETLLADGTKQSRSQSFFSGADTFTNIEKIVASPGNDIFNVHLDGGWTLDGQAGFDTLSLANRSEGIVATLGVATEGELSVLQGNVTGALLGTIAISNIESVVGSSGDDTFVVNDLAGWSALNDSAGWEFKGGTGIDTVQINGATGYTYNLNAVDVFGTTFSTIDIAVGQLRFSGMENIVAGAGNDVFVVRDLTGFTIDTGAGIDIVRFASGIDILDVPGGPDIENFEIVDLATDGEQNVVHFDLGDFDSIGNAAPLRILGGTNDIIQLTNTFGIGATLSKTGNNVLSDGIFTDGLTDGVLFDVYQVTIGDGQYQVYVQDGVQIPLPGAQDDQGAMTENEIVFIDVLANDAEGLGTTKTLTSLGAVTIDGPDGVPLGNPAIVIENGQIRVTPGTAFDALAAGETATITIPYTMLTGTGEALSAVATVTVTGTNDAPYFSVMPEGLDSVGTVEDSSFEGVDALQLTSEGATLAEIEAFLGLTAGTLDSIEAGTTDGAAVAFDLTLAAGETISFSWNFASTEYEPFNDYAFVSVASGFAEKLSDIFTIGDGANDNFLHSSGWQQFVYTADAAGDYRFGIGVVNEGDTAFDSFLYISGFSGIGFRRTTTEDGAAETFDLLNGAFDPDTNDEPTATNIVATGTDHLGIAIDITGAVTIDGNEVTIDPTFFSALSDEESVTIVINYDVSDGHTTRHNSATLVIAGADDNTAPTAVNDGVATTEDSAPVVFNVAQNDSDPQGTTLQAVNVSALSDPSLGTLVNNGNGQFIFTPAANASGSATFTYQASDGALTSANTATVTINVAPVNDAPTASNDTVATAEDSAPLVFNVAQNDSDIEGTPLSAVNVSALSDPSLGTLVNNGGGQFTFTPAANASGSATFTYQASDGSLTSSTATVTINVAPVNDAPVLNGLASPSLASVNENAGAPAGAVGTLVSGLVDFASTEGGLNNVTDVDSAATGIAIYAVNPTYGSLFYTTNGGATWSPVGAVSDASALLLAADANTRLYFQPNEEFTGTVSDAIIFRAWDQSQGVNGQKFDIGAGGINTTSVSGAPDTISVTVNAVNDAPVITAADLAGSVSAGAPISTVAAGYLAAGNSLINGLGGTAGFGESLLPANDDSSTVAIPITSVFEQGLNFFRGDGEPYFTSIYVNNNGNITFNGTLSTFTPQSIAGGQGNPIIAPFWADVETLGQQLAPTPGGQSAGTNLVYYDLDAENGVITITWDDVGYFSDATDKLNAFQLQLIDRGDGNFDIVFRYEDVNWTTGNASGGSGGLGGTPARAGYTAGDGNPAHYFELAGSGNEPAMLALEDTAGNTGRAGVYVFEVRSGDVGAPTSVGAFEFSDADVGDTHTVSSSFAPESSSQPEPLGALSVALTRDTAAGVGGLVTWQYTVDPALVDALAPGTVLTEVFTVTISDGHGGTVTQPVTITVNGPEREPVSLTVHTDAGFNIETLYETLFEADELGISPTNISLRHYGDPFSLTDDLIFEIATENLTWRTGQSGATQLTGGIVTGIDIFRPGDGQPIAVASFEGFDILATELNSAIALYDQGNESGLDALFGAYPYRATGGDGPDIFAGGNADDVINGEGGDDILAGGGGHDTFVFTPGGGRDIIADITLGNPLHIAEGDLIQLDGFGYDDVSDLTIVNNGQGFVRIVLSQEQSIDLAGIAHGTALNNHNFSFGGGLFV